MTAPTAIQSQTALDELAAQAESTAVALTGKLDAAIPYCPGWTGRDLACHLAGVYRWASTVVAERLERPPGPEERAALFADPDPGDDAGVLRRLREGSELIVGSLRAAPGDLECWTIWPAGQPREFWIRRQLHETVVHRVDAANAGRAQADAATGADLPADLAVDGIDEMVLGFCSRYSRNLRRAEPAGLALESSDTGDRWWIRIGSEGPVGGRGIAADPARTTVRGRCGELLLLLWNRRSTADLEIGGEADLLAEWRTNGKL
ncbi:MAG TPA: maleylpyruvate isomerase family mycothiol-dependent enzyme [Sporichthyaceae bacterium]|jgi:uncharacterized protein (TIGR03083 family)|nr:maleylpyruvate isomerase family mycothiol-dependent enzyme [Sporichthyaceae bacterium]